MIRYLGTKYPKINNTFLMTARICGNVSVGGKSEMGEDEVVGRKKTLKERERWKMERDICLYMYFFCAKIFLDELMIF